MMAYTADLVQSSSSEPVEEEADTIGVTYYVDEDGRYYYQPVDNLVTLLNNDPDVLEYGKAQTREITVLDDKTAEKETAYQKVTSELSKDINGEVNYVIVVQEENKPFLNVSIKQEKVHMEVHSFENGDVEDSTMDKEAAASLEITPRKKKRKKKFAPFTCNFCSYRSPKRYLLIRHMKSHSEERPHKCHVCDRKFKTLATLHNHTNMHIGIKPHFCKFCQSTFTTSGELVRHVRYKHTLEKPHKCSECDYASVELSKLRRHIRCHTGERPYQCPHCTYASSDTFKLQRHLRTHTGEKPYKCDLCTMCFTQSNTLKTHRFIHNVSEKPFYACERCPAKCRRKIDLRIHVQKLHTSDNPLKCKHCGKSLPDRYSLKMHNKTHKGEKCYKCNLCPYASVTLRRLKSHLLMHTNEKPFDCYDCNQCFRQKQLLRRHQNLYHNPDYVPKLPKEKIYTCHECNRTYAYKGNLIRHLAVHEPDSECKKRALTLKTVDDSDDRQYVVLEVIKLEDGLQKQETVVAREYLTMRHSLVDNSTVIKVNNSEVEDQEKTAAERSIKLKKEIKANFGFEEEEEPTNDEILI